MSTEKNSLSSWATCSLASAMHRLMHNTDHADFTVICGDKEWKVHSAILAVRSPFFEAAIANSMKEKLGMKIEIKEFDPEAMDNVINFMYGVSNEKASPKFLFEAAERFQMDDLKEYAVKLARKQINEENVVELAHLAETYDIKEFLGECAKFIVKNDVPLNKEDMSSKLALRVVRFFRKATRKLQRKVDNCESDHKVSFSNIDMDWSCMHNIRLTNMGWGNEQLLEYVGPDYDGGSAQAKKSISKNNHYFEIEIIDPGLNPEIGIGLAKKSHPGYELPGHSKGSIGYHADDGKVYTGSEVGDPLGPLCSKGDIMGCGVLFPTDYVCESDSDEEQEQYETDSGSGEDEDDEDVTTNVDKDAEEDVSTHQSQKVHVYFSRNGKIIGMKEVALPKGGFFPTVGLSDSREKVRVNLKPNCNPV